MSFAAQNIQVHFRENQLTFCRERVCFSEKTTIFCDERLAAEYYVLCTFAISAAGIDVCAMAARTLPGDEIAHVVILANKVV